MRKTTQIDKTSILNILTPAFLDNRSVNYIIKQDGNKDTHIRRLIEFSFNQGKYSGETYISDDSKGALIAIFSKARKNLLYELINNLKLIPHLGSILKVLKRQKYIAQQHPKSEFLHLLFIGVLPEFQGKGIGSNLLKEFLKHCDNQKTLVCLETSNPKNIPLYKRHGFETYHSWNEKNEDFTLWFMKRDPS